MPALWVMLVAAWVFLGWCAVAAASPFQIHLDRLGVPLVLPVEGKMIFVNIPAFELIAFEDGEPAFRSRVIVGAPWHRTPRLETHTTAVRLGCINMVALNHRFRPATAPDAADHPTRLILPEKASHCISVSQTLWT